MPCGRPRSISRTRTSRSACDSALRAVRARFNGFRCRIDDSPEPPVPRRCHHSGMTSDVAVLALALAFLGACDREAAPPAPSRAQEPAAERAAEPPPAASKPALVFLGDSLTAGFGLGVEQAVPALIQGEVDRAKLDLRVVNAGRSGD